MLTRKEIGSITIEATISLSIFIFAFLGISSLTRLVIAEERMQYALNQSAKELSQYMYIFYRAGLYSKENSDSTKTSDELIAETSQFTDMLKTKALTYTQGNQFQSEDIASEFESTINKFDQAKNDVSEIVDAGKSLANKYSAAIENPTEVLTGIYQVIKGETLSTIKSKIIAPVVGRLLMPKYLTTNSKNVDQYLEDIGVENGMNGINWGLSQIMEDGRTINLTIVYTIKYDIPLVGEYEFTVKQTASTAAWAKEKVVSANGSETTKKLSDLKTNIWDKASVTRGKEIVNDIKNRNESLSVNTNKTKGFDLYDVKTNTFSQIISINTGDATYLSTDSNGNVVLNESAFKNKIKYTANNLMNSMDSADKIVMNDNSIYTSPKENRNGTVQVYIPKGSQMLSEAKKYADEISKEYENITIKVIEYDE